MTNDRVKAWGRPAAAIMLVAFAVAIWLLYPRGRDQGAPASVSRVEEAAAAVTGDPRPASAPPMATGEPAYSPLADALHAERFDAAHDVAVLRDLIGQFTTSLRLAERPPLGDNADIAAALTGRNRRRIVFIPTMHPALRGGLLVDRLGTPYHFHARSADAIDVRSAGPDRTLFTADDLVSRLGEN